MRRLFSILAILALASTACGLPTVTPILAATQTATKTHAIPASITPDTGKPATVSRPIVRVHASPGGLVIGYVSGGNVVAVLRCAGDWCQIKQGWIWRGCLAEVAGKLGCEAK